MFGYPIFCGRLPCSTRSVSIGSACWSAISISWTRIQARPRGRRARGAARAEAAQPGGAARVDLLGQADQAGRAALARRPARDRQRPARQPGPRAPSRPVQRLESGQAGVRPGAVAPTRLAGSEVSSHGTWPRADQGGRRGGRVCSPPTRETLRDRTPEILTAVRGLLDGVKSRQAGQSASRGSSRSRRASAGSSAPCGGPRPRSA